MTFKKISNFVFVFIMTLPTLLWANEFLRPKTHRDLSDKATITIEVASQIEGATVVWANYRALRRDFPALQNLSESEICTWLLKNFAYVGYRQKYLNGIRNTPIPLATTESDPRFAFRLKGWLRAALMEAYHPDGTHVIGMVDAKGFGHGALSVDLIAQLLADYEKVKADPSLAAELLTRGHSDGVMTMGEAIAEVTRQQAAQELFEMSGLGFETVESYAILKMPFDVIRPGGEAVPAAMYLRQAHQDREQNLPVPKTIYTDERGKLQRTNMRTAVDFGGVIINDPRLNQDPNSGVSFSEIEKDNPQTSYPWIWAHRLAWNVARQYNPDLSGIYRHVEEMLAPLAKDYAESPEVEKRHREQRAMIRYIMYLEKKGKTYEEIRNLILSRAKILDAKFKQYENFLDSATKEEFDATAIILASSRNPIPSSLGNKIMDRATPDAKVVLSRVLFNGKDEGQLKLVKRGLADGNDRLRSQAAIALGKIKEPEAVELILHGLRTESSSRVRASYVSALAHRHDELSLSTLFDIIRGNETAMKSGAYLGLSGRTEPEIIPFLKKQIATADEYREAAVIALVGIDTTHVVENIREVVIKGYVPFTVALQKLLTLQNSVEALQALQEIQKSKRASNQNIIESIGEFTIPEARPVLLNSLLKKKEADQVVTTLKALQDLPLIDLSLELSEVLKNYRKDSTDNRAVRKAVADFCLTRGTLEYRRYLLTLLSDESFQVRFAVASGLATSSFKADKELGQKLASDQDDDLRALGYILQAGSESPQKIQELLDSPRKSLRDAGLKLLQGRNDSATLPILKKYLEDFDYSKKDLIRGYAGRRGPEIIDALRAFLNQETRFIRKEAIITLGMRDDAESIPLFEELFAKNDLSMSEDALDALMKRHDAAAEAYKKMLVLEKEDLLTGGLRYLLFKTLQLESAQSTKCAETLAQLP